MHKLLVTAGDMMLMRESFDYSSMREQLATAPFIIAIVFLFSLLPLAS
ncbi:hypothetical protein [uncultured Bacteroides sp.]|nr:hypothetical protein [uncultured Bacteroides sp.]